MTALEEFVCVAFVKRAGNEKDNVVDHVGVSRNLDEFRLSSFAEQEYIRDIL
jgi:hypothetical protein